MCFCVFFQSVVFPLWRWTVDAFAKRRFAAVGNYYGLFHGTIVEIDLLPSLLLLSRVEAYIALGQAEIGVRGIGIFVRCVKDGFPAVVALYRLTVDCRMEIKTSFAAIVVAESSFAEKPCEHRNAVFSFLQVAAYVYNVAVVVAGCGAAFQAALEDCKLAVYPQPIFTVGGYSCFGLLGLFVEYYLLAEYLPCIFAVFAIGGTNPFAVVAVVCCCAYAARKH